MLTFWSSETWDLLLHCGIASKGEMDSVASQKRHGLVKYGFVPSEREKGLSQHNFFFNQLSHYSSSDQKECIAPIPCMA